MSVRELCFGAELVLNYQATNHVFVGQFAGESGEFMINHSLLDGWGEGSPRTVFTALGRDDHFERYIKTRTRGLQAPAFFFFEILGICRWWPGFRAFGDLYLEQRNISTNSDAYKGCYAKIKLMLTARCS